MSPLSPAGVPHASRQHEKAFRPGRLTSAVPATVSPPLETARLTTTPHLRAVDPKAPGLAQPIPWFCRVSGLCFQISFDLRPYQLRYFFKNIFAYFNQSTGSAIYRDFLPLEVEHDPF